MSQAPTPAELVVIEKSIASGIAYVAGTSISWISFGGLFVLVPSYFLSPRRTSGQGRVQLVWLLIILVLTVVTNLLFVARVIQVDVYHWGDVEWLAHIGEVPLQNSVMYIANLVVGLCQLILIYRAFLFGASFRGGVGGWPRLAYIVLLATLALVGLALGLFATYQEQVEYKSLVAFADADAEAGRSVYYVVQATRIAMCLSVDALQTAILTVDLFKAITYNSNDVGVGRNLRELLWRLLKLTLVNGTFLVCLQLGLLVAFVSANSGWSVAFQTAMPCLRVVSLFSYLCSPEQSRAAQQMRETQQEDSTGSGGRQHGGAATADLEAARGAPFPPMSSTGSVVSASASPAARSASVLTDAERRRRKLPPASGVARSRPASDGLSLSWSAARHRRPTLVELPHSRTNARAETGSSGNISSSSSSGSAAGGPSTLRPDRKDRRRQAVAKAAVAERQGES